MRFDSHIDIRSLCHWIEGDHGVQRANRNRTASRGDITCLASPVTGKGVLVSRFEQMFLSARARGVKTSSKWAQDAWSRLKDLRRSPTKEGKALESEEDNLAELTRQANLLAEKRLPILEALQVAE